MSTENSNGYSYSVSFYDDIEEPFVDSVFFNNIYTYNKFNMLSYSGITIVVRPFYYIPETMTLLVVTSLSFRVCSDNEDLDHYAEAPSNQFINLFWDYYTNDNRITPEYQPINAEQYLIVTHSYFNNEDLWEFAEHKRNLGYDVDIVTVDWVGGNSETCKMFFYDYVALHPDLKYVLIVGDEGYVPFSSAEMPTMINPPTDLLYARHPNNNPFYSDMNLSFYIGRWPIHSIDALQNIVRKTINTELNLGGNLPYRAAIFTGIGSGKNIVYKNARKIQHRLLHHPNIDTYLVDGRSYENVSPNPALSVLMDELNGLNRYENWMFIYRGHGAINGYGSPYNFEDTHVSGLYNHTLSIQPFGFAFSCNLGDVFHEHSFAERWIGSNGGGVAYLASTTESLREANNVYAKCLFDQCVQNTPLTIGDFVYNGGLKYYNALKVAWRRNQIKRYVLYGDPSLYIYGLDLNTSTPRSIQCKNTSEETKSMFDLVVEGDNIRIMNTKENVNISVYNVQGMRIYFGSERDIEISNLTKGLYILYAESKEQKTSQKIVIH